VENAHNGENRFSTEKGSGHATGVEKNPFLGDIEKFIPGICGWE